MSCKVVVGNFLDDDLAVAFDDQVAFSDDFGPAFAHDGPGKMAARYAEDAPPGDPSISFGLNLVKAVAVNWTAVAGTVEDSADQDHGFEVTSLKVLGNGAQINSLRYAVRSGHSYWLEGWGFGSGTGPEARISVYNPNTKRWWNGSAWVDSVAYLLTGATAASWTGIGAGAGVRVDIEDASVTLGQTTTVQVQLWRIDNSTADPVYFDNIFLYPGVDFVGFFGGHNIPPSVVVELKTITSGGSAVVVQNLTKARGQFFWAGATPLYAYEWVITFDGGGTGDLDTPIYFGDLVVGKMLTLSKGPYEPVQIDYNWKGQARLETPGGSRWIANRGPAPTRTVTLNFRYENAEQEAEALSVWVNQVLGGQKSVVVMPSAEGDGPKAPVFPKLAIWGDLSASQGLSVSLRGSKQSGTAGGDLAGAFGTKDHYSDMTVVVEEGAAFEMDD